MHDHSYPHTPGHRDVETSVEAARSIEMSVGHLQRIAPGDKDRGWARPHGGRAFADRPHRAGLYPATNL